MLDLLGPKVAFRLPEYRYMCPAKQCRDTLCEFELMMGKLFHTSFRPGQLQHVATSFAQLLWLSMLGLAVRIRPAPQLKPCNCRRPAAGRTKVPLIKACLGWRQQPY